MHTGSAEGPRDNEPDCDWDRAHAAARFPTSLRGDAEHADNRSYAILGAASHTGYSLNSAAFTRWTRELGRSASVAQWGG